MGVAGDSALLRIEAVAAGGRGVGRRDGRVWFVDGALPGDLAQARAVRSRPRFVEARLERLVEPSAARRESPCPLQSRCGGCPLMPLPEVAQRGWQRRLIQESLRRIGRSDAVVDPVQPSPERLGYRNRVEFTLGRDEHGRPLLGLHGGQRQSGLVDVERCLLQSAAANDLWADLRGLLIDRAPSWVDLSPSEPFRVTIRRSGESGEFVVVLRQTDIAFPDAAGLAKALVALYPGLRGFLLLSAREGRRGGAKVAALHGRSWIGDRLGGLAYRLPATGFAQVNPSVVPLLIRSVVRAAGATNALQVLDLYGGVGMFGLSLAAAGARVEIVEANAEAIEAGRRAACDGGIENAIFTRAHVGTFLKSGLAAGRRAAVVVANPPRAGLGRAVPERLAGWRAGRLVVVSCDPATLSRDVARLEGVGYRLRAVTPIDLFPQTAHVESVATFERS